MFVLQLFAATLLLLCVLQGSGVLGDATPGEHAGAAAAATTTATTKTHHQHHQFCVIGGGPAGIQLGYFFARAGLDAIVYERSAGRAVARHDFQDSTGETGALEHVPVIAVPNLARALAELKERGFLTVGLDSEGETDLAAATLRLPLALVLGAEGKGLRQLTRATCDIRARLALPGAIKSLNVSNAAAVALYVAASKAMTPPGTS